VLRKFKSNKRSYAIGKYKTRAAIAIGLGIGFAAGLSTQLAFAKDNFVVPALPYAPNSLEPHISAETVSFHYEKHHKGYATKLNALVDTDPKLDGKSLIGIITSEQGKPFNLAAQVWNHTFYWDSMRPVGKGKEKPQGKLLTAIEGSFGSYEKFREEFNNKAVNHFGSGWAWLVQDKKTKKLLVVETHDAATPLTNPDHVPLLTCDVWEHSYYIDKRHDRASYVNGWWNLVNWEKVEERLQ